MAPQLRALPGLLQALALLPLSHAAVSVQVDRALAENPALRRRPGTPCPGCGRHRRAGPCPHCPREPRLTTEPAVDPFAELEVLAGCEIRPDCRAALPVVIGHLTERGLLPLSADDIAAAHGLAPAAAAEAIRALRVAGPPGIAERTVEDLLHAQARALVDAGRAPAVLPEFVRDHLAAVAEGDLDGPAAALGLPVAAVAQLLALVRTHLRPSVGLGAAPVRAVPDVLVRATDGELRVEVADSRWYGLALAPAPRRLRADPEAAAWLGGHERAARDLIRQLDSRATVLHRVATAAVAHQAEFLRRGAAAHRDLTRADVASALGLHPSTVSRAVAGKALRAPDGRILELAALFGRAVPVKSRIAALAPLRRSDERLRAALAAEGHVLARRTVAKYRSELGIAAGRGRS
jgi:RNA polymerase sigma-54 factor